MRTLLILSLLLLPFLAKAQKTTELKPKAAEAAVYQGGAVVTHRAERTGVQSLRLTGFPEYIDLGSLQISATADNEITGLRHEVNRSADGLSPQGRLKRDSLDAARYQLRSKAVQREALEEESALLKANREIGGEEQPLSAAELKSMADFIRSRVADVRQRALDISQEEASIDKRIKRLEQELAEMRARELQAQREIIVDLNGRKAARSNISVSYLTNRAGWTPHHDLRSAGTSEPLEIVTRAKVQQYTGVNWTDVKLTLVTGNPNLGGTAPVLRPWYLYLSDPAQQNYHKSDTRYRGDAPRLSRAGQEVAAMEDAEAVMPAFAESRLTLQTAYELPQLPRSHHSRRYHANFHGPRPQCAGEL
ncbi:MAG: mucoidy inhibitor MuiA family protein [Flavobacteriales bacterium]|nr:mucoidy inhibitor MuiA family protein [Flavobacteriales bacterium]